MTTACCRSRGTARLDALALASRPWAMLNRGLAEWVPARGRHAATSTWTRVAGRSTVCRQLPASLARLNICQQLVAAEASRRGVHCRGAHRLRGWPAWQVMGVRRMPPAGADRDIPQEDIDSSAARTALRGRAATRRDGWLNSTAGSAATALTARREAAPRPAQVAAHQPRQACGSLKVGYFAQASSATGKGISSHSASAAAASAMSGNNQSAGTARPPLPARRRRLSKASSPGEIRSSPQFGAAMGQPSRPSAARPLESACAHFILY